MKECNARLTKRERFDYAKGVYIAPPEPSFVFDADFLVSRNGGRMPLPERIANLKFERIGGTEYRVSLI